MSIEPENIFPTSGLVRRIEEYSYSHHNPGPITWNCINLEKKQVTVQSYTFGGYRSSTRLQFFLQSLDSIPFGELWDLQEYKDKIFVDLTGYDLPLILAPKAKFVPLTHCRVLELHLKQGYPELDSRLLRVGEIDMERSGVTNGDIFPSLEEAIESFSKLAHALRRATPSK